GFTVQGGFEYLNFMQRFVAENVKGDVEVDGVIETVKDLSSVFKKIGVKFEEERRFGKSGSKFVLPAQKISKETYKKLVNELFMEYLLFNVKAEGVLLKVKKKTTPKLGSPTDKFVTLKLPSSFMSTFKEDYLFDVDVKDFKDLVIEHKYFVENIDVDDKLLAKDAELARKKAIRIGEISRKLTVDGKVVKEYKTKFKV
ncbi:hypothetical protein HYX11_00210, partial [Candidatus Woesearchaeota archaeon]|nr:hypothetical protein [Candidatus Woesearchaeota archaeon]